MKALALVTENDDEQIKWLFDRILTVITYDITLTIVFVGDGCNQLICNKAWKAILMYGVDTIFDYNSTFDKQKSLISSTTIFPDELKKLISQSDLIL